MHIVLLVVSLLSLTVLSGCSNPFSKNESSCACTSHQPACEPVEKSTEEAEDAEEVGKPDDNDPMLAAAQVTPAAEEVDSLKQ